MVKLKNLQCTTLKAVVNGMMLVIMVYWYIRDYEAKTVKAKVLKVKFQNLGENGAEAYFTWEHRVRLLYTSVKCCR